MKMTAKHSAAAPEAGADPRVVRTRRMFAEALAKLLSQKRFEDISIQEIADEATLNRATFYLHYGDKTALLEELTASRFHDLVARRGLTFSGCDGGIQAIALGVFDYLLEEGGCPGQIDKLPSRIRSSARLRLSFAKAHLHIPCLKVSILKFWELLPHGPSLERHDAGSGSPSGRQQKKWPPALKMQ